MWRVACAAAQMVLQSKLGFSPELAAERMQQMHAHSAGVSSTEIDAQLALNATRAPQASTPGGNTCVNLLALPGPAPKLDRELVNELSACMRACVLRAAPPGFDDGLIRAAVSARARGRSCMQTKLGGHGHGHAPAADAGAGVRHMKKSGATP